MLITRGAGRSDKVKHHDWPWNRFVHAFATNGGSRHWEEQIEPDLNRYTWRALTRLSPNARKKRLEQATNPRRRKKNGRPWLAACFEETFVRVRRAGGPRALKKKYEAIQSPRERIEFWKDFPGIGNKYAREIPMGRMIECFASILPWINGSNDYSICFSGERRLAATRKTRPF